MWALGVGDGVSYGCPGPDATGPGRRRGFRRGFLRGFRGRIPVYVQARHDSTLQQRLSRLRRAGERKLLQWLWREPVRAALRPLRRLRGRRRPLLSPLWPAGRRGRRPPFGPDSLARRRCGGGPAGRRDRGPGAARDAGAGGAGHGQPRRGGWRRGPSRLAPRLTSARCRRASASTVCSIASWRRRSAPTPPRCCASPRWRSAPTTQLDTKDADARYHAAVLMIETGQLDEASALADTILAAAPDHLFGFLVRANVADRRDDSAAGRQRARGVRPALRRGARARGSRSTRSIGRRWRRFEKR